MWKTVFVLTMIAAAIPALAVEGSDVAYQGGTIPQLKESTVGKFDLTSGTGLRFLYSGGSLEIPYNRIESFKHSKEVAVHLGVAPAIAVGLVKRRRRNHFVQITFLDGNNLHQVAVFEIPKTMPRVLMPAFVARAPQARCEPFQECGPLPRLNPMQPRQVGNAVPGQAMTNPSTPPK